MDLHRDAALAFGATSLRAGGMLPYEGRSLLGRPEGLPPEVFVTREDGWVAPNNPILIRGAARIMPLAWRGEPESGYNAYAEVGQLAAFASRVQDTGSYWAGPWRTLGELEECDGASIRSYVDALRAAGATQVSSWTYSDAFGVALVGAGVEDEATVSLALHVVPVGWVSERYASGPVPGIDVRWSWAEVIDLFAARIAAEQPPDSAAAHEPERGMR
ncbi:hypothetical protein [Microbacterium sp. SA39]|uniref:hypothetical protein n=1 Tax=Microbacterium sp. SA39 TaxID=1263625 RepID=UPI00061EF49B|nr:hypothetical protein [Microbacterium sp. SA39]KJQ53327.1 hypothetical protein RS85_02841 [Microbacterium sp. SA39]